MWQLPAMVPKSSASGRLMKSILNCPFLVEFATQIFLYGHDRSFSQQAAGNALAGWFKSWFVERIIR
jgi:hypothetical protein